MCLRLSNQGHCLTLLSILGLLQTIVSLPIIILSFVVFASTSFGAALSPFWCGFIVSNEPHDLLAVQQEPSRIQYVYLANEGLLARFTLRQRP